ncbi:MAG: hypothetical protein DRP45_09980 [Candidatus Zixiibacteriota bacterium]|nr:MAG: hypothetical protein DRP45_09980 [candidate division Zixibacteria bacterium]
MVVTILDITVARYTHRGVLAEGFCCFIVVFYLLDRLRASVIFSAIQSINSFGSKPIEFR